MRFIRPFLFFISIGLVVGLIIFIPRVLKINKISCFSQFGGCDNFLQKEIGVAKGKSLVDAKLSIKKVLSSEILVENYTVQFNLPATLKVYLILRKPEYGLRNSSGNFALVDAKGYVVAKVSSSSLPFIQIGDNLPNPGDKLDDRLNFALAVTRDMNYLYQDVNATVTEEALFVKLPSGPTVIFPLDGDREALIGSARFIISRLMTGQENLRIDNVSQIDLRFKNPVLR